MQSTCRVKDEGVLATAHQPVPLEIRKDLISLELKRTLWLRDNHLEALVDPPYGLKSCNPLTPRLSLVRDGLAFGHNQLTYLGRNWFDQMTIGVIGQVPQATLN